MKKIKRMGLVGLLAAGLSLASYLPNLQAEHSAQTTQQKQTKKIVFNVYLMPDSFYQKNKEEIFGLVKEFYREKGVDLGFNFYGSQARLPPSNRKNVFSIEEVDDKGAYEKIYKPKIQALIREAREKCKEIKKEFEELGEKESSDRADVICKLHLFSADMKIKELQLDFMGSFLANGQADLTERKIYITYYPNYDCYSYAGDKLSRSIEQLGELEVIDDFEKTLDDCKIKNTAKTIVHEIGHIFGLKHTKGVLEEPRNEAIDDYVSPGIPNAMSYESIDLEACKEKGHKYCFDLVESQVEEIRSYVEQIEQK
jgi:predicted Zn-dependent protease